MRATEKSTTEVEPLSNKSSFKHHINKYSGLIAVILFCFVLFLINTGLFNAKYDIPPSRTQYPVVYVKDNTLNVKLLSKKTNTLSDYLVSDPDSGVDTKVFMSKDGSAIYFLENYEQATRSGSVFVTYDGKTKIPVSSKAFENIKTTYDGKYALFVELPNIKTMSGPLYIYNKGGKKEKVADNVSLSDFTFSENAKHFAYIQLNSDSNKGDLYIQKISGNSEKIDSNVSKIVYVSAFDSAWYIKNSADGKSELHYWQKDKAPIKISGNAFYNMVYTSKFEDNIFLCGDNSSPSSYTLYSKMQNKDKTVVDTNVVTALNYDAKYQNIIYTKNFSQTDFSYDTYLKRKGGEPIKLLSSKETKTPVMNSYDFKTVSYISDISAETGFGSLYIRKFGIFKDNQIQLVAKNVSSFKMSPDGKILAYIQLDDKNKNLYIYKNGKAKLVAQSIEDDNYMFANNSYGMYYIANYNQETSKGNLFFINAFDIFPKSVKINSDVNRIFYPRSNKQVIYTKNYNNETGISELYIWRGGSKSEQIDKGVIKVLFER